MEWWNGITDLTFGSGGVLVVPELSEGGYKELFCFEK